MKKVMNTIGFVLMIQLLTIGNGTAQDYINIQNIFDVGINLGNLSAHQQAGSGGSLISTWSTNATAEWSASISPAPSALTLENPDLIALSASIQSVEFRLMLLANACQNPWFSSAKSVFLAGLSLSRSYVIAGGACIGCLRNEMILASIYLENAANSLIQNGLSQGAPMKNFAQNLKDASLNMPSQGEARSAAQQNVGYAPMLKQAMDTMDSLLINQNLTCSPANPTPAPSTSSSDCNETHRNHHVFNAGLAIGMLNYAAMINLPVVNIAIEGHYIDEAIIHYQASCCLDAGYLLDLKKRISLSASTRPFYQEITDHFLSLGPSLEDCNCAGANSASIYSAGIAMGWAEFAALQDVSADYIASAYLATAMTHLDASQCLTSATTAAIQQNMQSGGSSRPFYTDIQAERLRLSEESIAKCACHDQSSPEHHEPPSVVERTSLCGEVNKAGGDAPERHSIQFNKSQGSFTFHYNTFTIPDRMQVFNGQTLLFDSDCVGTNGWTAKELTLAGSDQIIVNIIPNCERRSSTKWEFRVSCPDEVTTATPGTGFEPGRSDKVDDVGSSSSGDHSPSSSSSGIGESAGHGPVIIPTAPTGPKNGEWWYPLDEKHPFSGKDHDEIIALGGVLQMYIPISMAPNSYYFTDKNGDWINYNPGTYGPSRYYYIDWTEFNKYHTLLETKPITNDGTLYQAATYVHKDSEKKTTFRIYRQPDFNPHAVYGPEVVSWAIGKNHPWYGKSIQDLEAMGAKALMYFRHVGGHNTYIYQDPYGQLIQANSGWRKTSYILDWNRFTQNHTLVSEGHKQQTWKQNADSRKKYLFWL